MTSRASDRDPYDEWLEARRCDRPSMDVSDRVMAEVTELERQRVQVRWLFLVDQIERRRMVRWALCGGALAVGSLPYLFLAHVSSF